jgi:ArsR family transcriptional regulator
MIRAVHQPDALLARMASLADPTRLRLLRLLEAHELGVVDLCEVLQMPQSTVSRHLKVLSDQGWTTSRRQGTTNLYSMTADELEEPAQQLWELARQQTDDWATLEQDELRLRRRLAGNHRDAEAFFSGAAAEWDRLRGELYGQSFTQAALAALLPSGWTVADLGCGTGQTAQELAGSVAQVIAVDNNPAMLKAAKRRLSGLANVDVRRGELEALPIEDAACDAAVLMLVLTYVADEAAVLAEARRVLKPGGTLVIVDLLRHDREDFRKRMGQQCMGFDLRKVETLLRDAGFAGAGARALPLEASATGPALFVARGVKGEV